jgi:hypothetical protein
MQSYKFYLGGLVETVTAKSERDAFRRVSDLKN